jgi:hypothetical protein
MRLRVEGSRSRGEQLAQYERQDAAVLVVATTSGGEARKFALRLGWMRASKLRLPDSTAAQTRSFRVMTSLSSGARSPALLMQVVQP